MLISSKLKQLLKRLRQENAAKKRKAGVTIISSVIFAKPVIMSTYDVPSYFKSYYELIQNLSNEEPSLDRISELIERDISLSYKFLKLINSPAYRPKQKINSIRQAIVLLGLIELEKWIYVLAVREDIFQNSQMAEEAIGLSMTRAKMREEIGRLRTGKRRFGQLFYDRDVFINGFIAEYPYESNSR